MILANPIYDVVFKLLMNDLDVAKGFIGRILGREIVKINVSQQEVPIRKLDHDGQTITLLRMDFSAVILDEAGRESQVLIEIQKAKIPEDIGRFRHYLGEQYKARTDSDQRGDPHQKHLPIFTIYLLNFSLSTELPPLVRVQRECQNAATSEPITGDLHDEFIECLTHDSFIAQISKLPDQPHEYLERTFALFNQKLISSGDNRHKLFLDDGSPLKDDELLSKMMRILNKAVAEPEVSKQMEHEDVLQQDLERSMRKLEQQISLLEEENEQERKLKEQEKTLREKEQRLKEQAIAKQAEEKKLREQEKKLREQEKKLREQKELQLLQAFTNMVDSGMDPEQARELLGLPSTPPSR
jgi:hypothetical protein